MRKKKDPMPELLELLDGVLMALIILSWLLCFGCLYSEARYHQAAAEICKSALELEQGRIGIFYEP